MPDPSRAGQPVDWAALVRPRLASLRLSPAREAEIVDELSQHLDDRRRELLIAGVAPDEATHLALAEFTDADTLARYMAPLRQSTRGPRSCPACTPATRLPISGETFATPHARCAGSRGSPPQPS